MSGKTARRARKSVIRSLNEEAKVFDVTQVFDPYEEEADAMYSAYMTHHRVFLDGEMIGWVDTYYRTELLAGCRHITPLHAAALASILPDLAKRVQPPTCLQMHENEAIYCDLDGSEVPSFPEGSVAEKKPSGAALCLFDDGRVEETCTCTLTGPLAGKPIVLQGLQSVA